MPSVYKGVSKSKAEDRWRARLWVNGESQQLGSYDSEEDAARVYDAAVYECAPGRRYKKVYNFPSEVAESVRIAAALRGAPKGRGSSKYKGVRSCAEDRWRAQLKVNGESQHLGSYDSEKDAARVYDAALYECAPGRRYKKVYNFPGEREVAKSVRIAAALRRDARRLHASSSSSSGFGGGGRFSGQVYFVLCFLFRVPILQPHLCPHPFPNRGSSKRARPTGRKPAAGGKAARQKVKASSRGDDGARSGAAAGKRARSAEAAQKRKVGRGATASAPSAASVRAPRSWNMRVLALAHVGHLDLIEQPVTLTGLPEVAGGRLGMAGVLELLSPAAPSALEARDDDGEMHDVSSFVPDTPLSASEVAGRRFCGYAQASFSTEAVTKLVGSVVREAGGPGAVGPRGLDVRDASVLRRVVPRGTQLPTSSGRNGGNVFITKGGPSRSGTHKDKTPALLWVLRGHKRIWLAPSGALREAEHHSEFDPFADGGAGSPWWYLELKEGEAVLIPAEWWHAVDSPDGAVALAIELEQATFVSV